MQTKAQWVNMSSGAGWSPRNLVPSSLAVRLLTISDDWAPHVVSSCHFPSLLTSLTDSSNSLKIILFSITFVCIFSLPLSSTLAKLTFLPCFYPPPWFCPWILYSSSWKPFSPLSLPLSPLAIVRLFLTSVSLAIFCLLFSSVDYVPESSRISLNIPTSKL